jgi:tetratricopeptide (TPR) repeat protein
MAAVLGGLHPSSARAADTWIEVKSPHFTVTSNASPKDAATVAWEFEQIRSAIGAVWTWARVDLNKPLVVVAVKDENSMKAFAPQYWEQKNAVHPASVWVGGADQNYLAIRSDVRGDDNRDLNPYQQAYFSYVSLVMGQSLPRDLPLWFRLGFAGVVSNTVVRQQKVSLGPPIPRHLKRLNEQPRLSIARLIAVDRSSPEYTRADSRDLLDAESWAFVHFLMFGENGARWSKLDQFVTLVGEGTDTTAAFREAFGSPDDLMEPFSAYLRRNVYSYRQFAVDASVKADGFTVRPLSTAEEETRRALFHAAMRRPAEASAAVAAARQAGQAPDSFVAEGLLFDADGKQDDAQAAYAHAVEAGATDAYAYYRLASLTWRGNADRATLQKLEPLLQKAVDLNNRYAAAYAMLGEVHSILDDGDGLGFVMRAISLDPSNGYHHLAAARVLLRARRYDDALQQAAAAYSLAKDDALRRQVDDVTASIQRAKG